MIHLVSGCSHSPHTRKMVLVSFSVGKENLQSLLKAGLQFFLKVTATDKGAVPVRKQPTKAVARRVGRFGIYRGLSK